MRIVQVNHSDVGGGAARAAYRLHRGLLSIGETCSMVVKQKLTNDKDIVLAQQPNAALNRRAFLFESIQEHINTHRTEISNTIFSFSYPGSDISTIPHILATDIVNLHWVANFQSPTSLRKLFASGKPVVWTLHDQWAFTGGCHYSAGCKKYMDTCADCPQLTDALYDLPSKILLDKMVLFADVNMTIVAPSNWLKECAKESRLFNKLRIEVIPNSLETDIFIPKNKREAKKKLGIDTDVRTLLFGAENGREKRKGYHELLRAIEHCKSYERFNTLMAERKIILLLLGHPGEELTRTGLPIHPLGYVNSDEQLADIYSAADVFVLPSLEDNLPNTMLESMSCGTPVIAFDTGGMRDLIQNDITGMIVTYKDTAALGNAITDLLFDQKKIEQMGYNCSSLIHKNFKLKVQAARYRDLYSELVKKTTGRSMIRKNDGIVNEPSSLCIVKTDLSTGAHFKRIEKAIGRRVWEWKRCLKKIRSILNDSYFSVLSFFQRLTGRVKHQTPVG